MKIRDESMIGTALECPDCHASLLIVKQADGELIGQEIVPDRPETKSPQAHPSPARTRVGPPAAQSSAQRPDESPRFEPFPATLSGSRTPQIVAWAVAGVCVLGLIPFFLPSAKRPAGGPEIIGPPLVLPEKSVAVNPPVAAPNVKPENVQPGPAALPDSPAGRLTELGKIVLENARQAGHFPSGTVPSPDLVPSLRWSWLAQVAGRLDNPNGLQIDWSHRWNDVNHDRFIRRPIPRYQNPQIENKVSEDRYPATHFVGVAGVGADAPLLPADHPRAGIFGQDRQTKIDQIRDGVSNTMLLAGVREHLTSWADGTGSYRPFTREPYINGPDGFGTGQADRMLVLMADGSVREIHQQTDPRLVRRMAAMSDGFPLDADIPGEPGDPRPGTVPVPDPLTVEVKPVEKAMPAKAGAPAAAEPPPVPVPEKVLDIPALLSRKILNFDQSKPAAAFELILQIEELSGVPILYDRAKLGEVAKRLDKPITLKKQNATLEELLDDILQQINLQRQSQKTGIVLVPPAAA